MLEHFRSFNLFSMAEQNHLRTEAMTLFERCLTEGTPHYLRVFIEEQIAADRIEVLRDVCEDLYQRLLGLRAYHLDVYDRAQRALKQDYGVDLGAFVAADAYYLLTLEAALAFVRQHNPTLGLQQARDARKLLEASLELAAQLQRDIHMTEELVQSITDWMDALGAALARRYWMTDREIVPGKVH
jgi:hypothetical protein